MERFARLLDDLVYTQSRNGKLALLEHYFRTAPDPDRGWALAALTDGLPLRLPLRRAISNLLEGRVDPVLYRLSRDYVGDTAETVALLWPEPAACDPAPRLGEVVATFLRTPPAGVAAELARLLDRLDVSGRFALLKLLGGAPRVGVSARLAKTALADAVSLPLDEVEELWHALAPPFADLFAFARGEAEKPTAAGRATFRPMMLAHPLEDTDRAALNPAAHFAEWKWDGIRIEIAAKGDDVRLFSRAGDDVSRAFPEIRSAFAGRDLVADGELLIARDGTIAPFNDLQQRLNRKTVTAAMLRDHPAFVRLYDLLFLGREDLRPLPFEHRRARLESWHAAAPPPSCDVSPLVPFATLDELERLWAAARTEGIEGLMLKHRASPYLAGRVKGHWWKWKRAALTLDCVLMYAQRGSGKRSSFYSDYTFGVWRAAADGARELVPVGKAYSGFTDAELRQLDRWIRDHTTDRFGPVRAVSPGLVLEVAFDAVHRSTRHKSGLAMRFPRIARIRWDKPAAEADTLETVERLLAS